MKKEKKFLPFVWPRSFLIPQMAPMNWIFLFTLFATSFSMVVSKISLLNV